MYSIDNDGGDESLLHAFATGLVIVAQRDKTISQQLVNAYRKYCLYKAPSKIVDARVGFFDRAIKKFNPDTPHSNNMLMPTTKVRSTSVPLINEVALALRHQLNHIKQEEILDKFALDETSRECKSHGSDDEKIRTYYQFTETYHIDTESNESKTAKHIYLAAREMFDFFRDPSDSKVMPQYNFLLDDVYALQKLRQLAEMKEIKSAEEALCHGREVKEYRDEIKHGQKYKIFKSGQKNKIKVETGYSSIEQPYIEVLISKYLKKEKSPTRSADIIKLSEAYQLQTQLLHYTGNPGLPYLITTPNNPRLDDGKKIILKESSNLFGNPSNWRTSFPIYKSNPTVPTSIQKFEKFIQNPLDGSNTTAKEIISLFKDYTRYSFKIFSNRHHDALANEIIQIMERESSVKSSSPLKPDPTEAIFLNKDLLGKLQTLWSSDPKTFNTSGDFAKRIDFLCYRAHGQAFASKYELEIKQCRKTNLEINQEKSSLEQKSP